jgi:hypothetical protein
MDAKAAGDLDLTRRRVNQSDKDRHRSRPVVRRLAQLPNVVALEPEARGKR